MFFWIEEDGQPYPPSLRSAGRIWHLSFYVKLTARSTGDTPPVILVDDPGLHLHAKAQKDILNKLEDIASRSRVIYSTHSPYLIDTKKLNRVWLVNKSESNGTKIDKLHAGADKDTLRPVLTAIGADTTLGLHLDKDNQVVVEGISDYHYLHSFREIIDWEGDVDIIPGTGGSTPVYIGSILFGWGIDPIFCLDPDDPNRNARKLEEELGIDEDNIIYVYDGDGAIEDLFTKNDFKEYVLEDPDVDYSGSNSDYLQDEDKDKVVLAKTFYEDVYADQEVVELGEETIEAITTLFDKIENALSSS